MRVFKYRSGSDKDIFNRDLSAIEKNCLWGPSFNQLNDPCETLIISEKFKSITKSAISLFGKNAEQRLNEVHKALDKVISRKVEIGIYSLSTTYDDELLWAHYANSHKGFCIEYDLDLLLETYQMDRVYHFPVSYTKRPPEIKFSDLADKTGISILKKIAGNKSKRWKYEKEHRIIINSYGDHPYNHNALKAIYFGLRMDDSSKLEIMNRLKGRGIKYYQIKQMPDHYLFEREEVEDIHRLGITYLCQVPELGKDKKAVDYIIIEKDFNKYNGKATIKIELDSKLKKEGLIWLSNTIKDNLFCKAERIFITYVLKGMVNSSGCWASANFSERELNISINGLTPEQEVLLMEGLKNESRNPIGMWIDETPLMCSSMILLHNTVDVILETNYYDGSKSVEKLKLSNINNKVRYENYKGNPHGEYFIIEESGELMYYSPNGLIKTLQPFRLE
jgi:hypothetical protein